MSRRTSRSHKSSSGGRPTDGRNRATNPSNSSIGPSWAFSVGLAVAALVLTLASASPIYSVSRLTTNRRGMLTAILDVEFVVMKRPIALPGETTFNSVAQRYNGLRRQRDSFDSYATVQRLRGVFADEAIDNRPAQQSTLDQCAAQLESDPRNFISRLLYALILESRQRRGAADPAARFATIADTLGAPPRLSAATTYDDEYRDVLEEAFAANVKRRDISASMASKWYDPFLDSDETWDRVLPEVAKRIADLRSALKDAGDTAGADACDRWLARFFLGVIESSADAGLQCHAADILARHLPDHPGASESMRRMIRAHTIDAPSIGADWAAQFKGEAQYPLAPDAYQAAMDRLFLWGLAISIGLGAAIGVVFAIASIVAPCDPEMSPADDTTGARRSRWLQAIVIGLIPLALALWRARVFGATSPYYAESYAIAIVQMFAFLALSLTLVHAILRAWPDADVGRRLRRAWPAALLALLCVTFLVMPAPSANWLLRRLNYGFPQMLWSAGAMMLFMMFAALVARVPARRLMRSAAGACVAAALLACVAMLLHVRADRAYETEVVAAYHDPMAARVGADWKTTYLEPVRRDFDPPLP